MKIGSFDDTVAKVLDIAVKRQEDMHDSCFLVGGMEGSGKSDFILTCIDYLDKKRNLETPISNLAYNLKDFFLSLKTSNPCDVVALDEGKELMAMNYGDKQLKDAINIFTVIRKKRLITFLAFTNPAKITQYFREDRIRGVFLLKKRQKDYSVIYYYTKTEFLRILSILRLQKNLNISSILKQKPLLICYKKGAYNGRLKSIYEINKDNNIENQLDLVIEKYHNKKLKTYSLNEVTKLLGCSQTIIDKIVPMDFRDKYRDNFGTIRFNEEALNKIKNDYATYISNAKYTKFKAKNKNVGKMDNIETISIHK